MVQAVLAIEDRRFYDHPGVDIIRTIGAVVTNLRGDRPYLVGGSTITQQLVKNFFLTPAKSLKRKLAEQYMAIILERKASKDEILELYLNDVYLGQRGSFAVHGVAEAARLYFGKDVTNLSLSEAATIAGVIQSPYYWSPFAAPGPVPRAAQRRAGRDGGRGVHLGRRRRAHRRPSPSRSSSARSTRRRPTSSTSWASRWASSFRGCRRAPIASRCSRRSIRTCSAWRRTRSAKG